MAVVRLTLTHIIEPDRPSTGWTLATDPPAPPAGWREGRDRLGRRCWSGTVAGRRVLTYQLPTFAAPVAELSGPSTGWELATAHAPKGGVTIQGTRFAGGEFVPAEVLAEAREAERAAVEFRAPDEGARDAGAAAPNAPRRKPRPMTRTKSGGRLARLRDVGRRRQVIAALKSEDELAEGIGGKQLPESEPADVLLLLDALGEPVTDAEALKQALRQREEAVRALRRLPKDDPRRADYARVLEPPLLAFEVKTLLVQGGAGAIHMSGPAVARKERFEKRYGAVWSTVAMDKRRGAKQSGHLLYFKVGLHSGKLAAMEKVADFSELLALAAGG